MKGKVSGVADKDLDRPFGLRPFCSLASFRFGQVAGYLSSSRLANQQNASHFSFHGFSTGF